MYENLLGQDRVRAALESDVREDRLPPSLLFSGPPGSGKLTAALETARVLSCDRGGAWDCPCPSCGRHRSLVHPDLLLFGSRTFPEEPILAREILSSEPGKAQAYFFTRAVRKVLCRFDAPLWAGEESRLSKAAPLVREAEEALSALDPERFGEGGTDAFKAADSALAACARLEAMIPDAPGVFMIRNMELWSRSSPLGRRKTVVIENADTLLDSARNAMLKMLEEPPDTVRFILLTSRRAAVMATILSRSRTYPFAARDAAGTAEVLLRVFRSQRAAADVASFLAGYRPFPSGKARDFAEALVGALAATGAATGGALVATGGSSGAEAGRGSGGASGGSPGLEAAGFVRSLALKAESASSSPAAVLAEVCKATGDFGSKDDRMADSFRQFLRALLDVLADILRDPGSGPGWLRRVERWTALIREVATQRAVYNRNPELLAAVLVGRLGDER